MATDFLERCEVIEECYEFLLAYAGQGGLPTKAAPPAAKCAAFWTAPVRPCAA